MDTVADILQGYGLEAETAPDRVWSQAVPLLLDALEEQNVPATFFVIGRDTCEHGGVIRDLVARGHEVASHSMTHRQPFRRLPRADQEWEVRESKGVLEDLIGTEVLGFKAPGWDADRHILRAVARAGYTYDASGFPSPMLVAARTLIWWSGHRRGLPINGSDLGQAFGHRNAKRPDRHGLRRFPVATTRCLRIPVYNTMRHYVGDGRMDRMIGRLGSKDSCASFTMHGIDLLDLEHDGVPAELGRHPGLTKPLAHRLDALVATLKAFRQAGFVFRRFKDEVAAEAPQGRPLDVEFDMRHA
jgi:hypothetical protein